MNTKDSLLTAALLLLNALATANAQEKRILTFGDYMNHVGAHNAAYLAEKYNVSVADAKLEASRLFPDPELSAGYDNNQDWNLQMGYALNAGLSYTLELGGKRKARISVAQSEKEMTEALLEDYFRNLRAEAAIAYFAALKQKEVCRILQSSYRQTLELARADSIRHSLGFITETDARQSKLEAATLLNEVYAAEAELQNALIQLALLQGYPSGSLPPDSLAGELFYPRQEFNLEELVAAAQRNSAGLRAALKSRELSQNNLRLAKANRAIDLGISLGGSRSSVVRNEIAPAPAFTGISAGISVPLKFSNANKGELRAARMAARQSELAFEAVERQIDAEVSRVYTNYLAHCRQAEQFEAGGLLDEAETIVDRKAYSYQRGETSILEALNARRTCNEIQLSYVETLYNCVATFVELERACGVWSIHSRMPAAGR
jgi:cobalt-zinc-cadmium efflux system outer membrane protein